MVGLEHKINSGSVMAGLLSLDQAQMVGLMVVWVCVVIGGWLFFSSGKVDCAVCVVVVGWLFFGNGCGLCRLWCFLQMVGLMVV